MDGLALRRFECHSRRRQGGTGRVRGRGPIHGHGISTAPARRRPGPRTHTSPARSLRLLTAVTLALSYLLVVLGDTVRVTHSGMGCRSWPLCNGHIGLTGTVHAMLEQSHRYLAAMVTIMVVVTFVVAWRSARRDHLVFRAATTALALIGTQVALGALTVFAHNAGWTVALHLAGAWLVVGAVTVTAMGAWRVPRTPLAPRRTVPAGRLGAAAVIVLFVLSVTGMLVLHEGASRVCPGWPFCGAGTGPAGLVALQYLHRSFALLAGLVVVAAAVRAWRSPLARVTDRSLAVGATLFLAGTAAGGAVVATTGALPAAQAFHLAVATALWISVVALATPIRPGQVPPSPASPT